MAPPTRAAVGRDALIPPHPAPPRTPAGGYGIRPTTNGGRAANRKTAKPCVTSNPCRGRCSHRPGGPYAARMPAGGMPSSRRTPRRREPPRADMESAPTTNGGRAANRETANPALHQTPVGDDARIVPGDLTPRERPRADMESAPTTNGGCAAQPGNRCPCVIINFCRGRCSHRPADLAPPHGSLPIRAK